MWDFEENDNLKKKWRWTSKMMKVDTLDFEDNDLIDEDGTVDVDTSSSPRAITSQPKLKSAITDGALKKIKVMAFMKKPMSSKFFFFFSTKPISLFDSTDGERWLKRGKRMGRGSRYDRRGKKKNTKDIKKKKSLFKTKKVKTR